MKIDVAITVIATITLVIGFALYAISQLQIIEILTFNIISIAELYPYLNGYGTGMIVVSCCWIVIAIIIAVRRDRRRQEQ